MLKVENICPFCGKRHSVEVLENDFKEYQSKERRDIQFIFPYLKPEEREILITGICLDCWKKLFDGGDDEKCDIKR